MLNIINYPSPNFNDRPKDAEIDCVVLHYTDVASLEEALQILTDPKRESRVSCHYVIDDDGSVYQLVDTEKRAWHAGVSSLHGKNNVNDFSVTSCLRISTAVSGISSDLLIVYIYKVYFPVVSAR